LLDGTQERVASRWRGEVFRMRSWDPRPARPGRRSSAQTLPAIVDLAGVRERVFAGADKLEPMPLDSPPSRPGSLLRGR
jgi:hypothetical protein